jgi:hypothetical protein
MYQRCVSRGLALLLIVAAAAGCSAAEESLPEERFSPPISSNSRIRDEVTASIQTLSSASNGETRCSPPGFPYAPRSEADSVVSIALYCESDDESQMVERLVPTGGDQIAAAFEQLLIGVTPEEHQAGLRSPFTSYTAGQFNSVTVESDGVVILDLTPGFVSTNNFSTSSLSLLVLQQIEVTLFAIPEVAGIEFTVDGDRWCGWESGPCSAVPWPFIGRGE